MIDTNFAVYTITELLSAFSMGAILMAAFLDIKLRKFRFDANFFRALTKAGVATILGLLVWLIYPERSVQFNYPLVIYTVGLLLISVGSMGTVLRTIRIIVEEEE